jgi:hypothetical protein
MNRWTTRPGFWAAAGTLLVAMAVASVGRAGEVGRGEIPLIIELEPEVLEGEVIPYDHPLWVSAEATTNGN